MTPTRQHSTAQPSIASSGFVVLRTPLLSFQEFLDWGDGLEASTASQESDTFEQAWLRDGDRLRAKLRAIVRRPEVREALFVGSHDLNEQFETRIGDHRSKRGRAFEHALVRYFSRMAGRATPFGLFAGCSVGTVGPRTVLSLGARSTYQRRTSLDIGFLEALTEALGESRSAMQGLCFRPNESLYPVAGRYHYAELDRSASDAGHDMVAVEGTPHLALILERAAAGENIGGLADGLKQLLPNLTTEKARRLIEELIDHQILTPTLRPQVTGPDPLGDLIAQLEQIAGAGEITVSLRDVRQSLTEMDEARAP